MRGGGGREKKIRNILGWHCCQTSWHQATAGGKRLWLLCPFINIISFKKDNKKTPHKKNHAEDRALAAFISEMTLPPQGTVFLFLGERYRDLPSTAVSLAHQECRGEL